MIFKTPSGAKEHRALTKANVLMDISDLLKMAECAAPVGSRIITVETVDDSVDRVVVGDGNMKGCRGFIAR